MSEMVEVIPIISDQILTNPGIGFIAAPPLMGEQNKVLNNHGNEVEKYKFTPDGKTYNHPDSKTYYCGCRWKDLEPEKGKYDWTSLKDKLEISKEMGCVSVVRCAPYALSEEDDIPAWFREEYPDEPDFPFWKVDPNTTPYADYWAKFIMAFAKEFDGHPLISSVDMAIVGAWGEGGGTEFLDKDKIKKIIDAYLDGFQITPMQALLHDPVSMKVIKDRKTKIGFRVDCLGDMGGFHGTEWSHMLDFYPQNIQNFNMDTAWKDAPVVFEACWHMNDWYRQGWDIDYIIDESLKWHISSYNSKATTVPSEWKASVERWLKKMGYRFELRRLGYNEKAQPGGNLQVSGLWANVGVAPIYTNYPLVIRLVGEKEVYKLTSKEDIRSWLPDMDILWEEVFVLPNHIEKGQYSLEVGIETQIAEVGNVKLAIAGEQSGYYPMGTFIIE